MATYGTPEWIQQMYGSQPTTTPTPVTTTTAPLSSMTESYYDKMMEDYRKRQAQKLASIEAHNKLIQSNYQSTVDLLQNISSWWNAHKNPAGQAMVTGQNYNQYNMTHPYNYAYQTYPQFTAQGPQVTNWYGGNQSGTPPFGSNKPNENSTYYNSFGNDERHVAFQPATPAKPPYWNSPHTYYNSFGEGVQDEHFASPYVPALGLPDNSNPPPPPGYSYQQPAYHFGGGGGGRRSSGGIGRAKQLSAWYQGMINWNINKPQGG